VSARFSGRSWRKGGSRAKTTWSVFGIRPASSTRTGVQALARSGACWAWTTITLSISSGAALSIAHWTFGWIVPACADAAARNKSSSTAAGRRKLMLDLLQENGTVGPAGCVPAGGNAAEVSKEGSPAEWSRVRAVGRWTCRRGRSLARAGRRSASILADKRRAPGGTRCFNKTRAGQPQSGGDLRRMIDPRQLLSGASRSRPGTARGAFSSSETIPAAGRQRGGPEAGTTRPVRALAATRSERAGAPPGTSGLRT